MRIDQVKKGLRVVYKNKRSGDNSLHGKTARCTGEVSPHNEYIRVCFDDASLNMKDYGAYPENLDLLEPQEAN